jgi:uncharacterized protein
MDLAPPQPLEAIDAGLEPAFRKHWRGWPMVWIFAVVLLSFYFVQVLATLVVLFARFGGLIRQYTLHGQNAELMNMFKAPEWLGRMFDPPSLFVIQLVSTIALVGLTLLLCRVVLNAQLPDLGLGRPLNWRYVGIGVVAGIALLFISGALEWIQERLVGPHPQAILHVFAQHRGPLALILDLLSVAVLAPLAEELFFRGFLFTGLVQRMQLGVAATISGLLFGLAHADLWNAVPLSALGIGLALVYYRSGSLWTNIIAHATINGTQLLLIFLVPALAK